MKIGLDLTGKAIKEYTPQLEVPKYNTVTKSGAVVMDLSGSVIDNKAYAEHGKTLNDVMEDADSLNVATTRNYMTVMSNTMSDDDYKKMLDGDFDPSEISYEDSVTILDHIKTAVAESGHVIEGYNDDMSDSAIKEVAGSKLNLDDIKAAMEKADIPTTPDNLKKLTEAVSMMEEINVLPEGTVKYMVENDVRPTVSNIYTARFSANDDGSKQSKGYYAQDANGYYARKAEVIDWESIKPQVEKALVNMQLPTEDIEDQLNDAKWLIEKGIPVTEEKLTQLENIESIEFPVKAETVIEAGIEAIYEGKEPKDADLSTQKESIYKKAVRQREVFINASLNREEARLNMSIDANLKLIKKGISIDTKPIEEVIEALKKEEEKLRSSFLGESENIEESDKKADLFRQTRNIIEELPSFPLLTVGRITDSEESLTLTDVHSIGKSLKVQLENAGIRYEEMSTEIRKDLGDSINKAFRNVDDILKDLGKEVTDKNRRAVRILGYNNMDISIKSVEKVAAADEKLQNVINGLTPGKTLKLIREGINPLGIKLDDLVEEIDKLDTDPKKDVEKFSRFLYKLEQTNEITDEEKESYIGIYRMLNQLEKNDHAAIGRLLESGADITFGNLVTAIRSSKKSVNLKIDDNFGLLNETVKKGISITDQIESAFRNTVDETLINELEKKYEKEQMEELRESFTASDEIINELLESNVSVSPENVQAARVFIEDPDSLFNMLRAYGKRINRRNENENNEKSKLEKAIEEYPDKMTDSKSAKEGYKSLLSEMTDTLTQMTELEAETTIDLNNIKLMHKQISLAAGYSLEENYHIPVNIDGRLTDINVKIVHGKESGYVTTYMEMPDIGKLGAQIAVRDNRTDVVFISENKEGLDVFKNISEAFAADLNKEGIEDIQMSFVTGNPKTGGKLLSDNTDNNSETVETSKLYKIAKSFILEVRNKG